MRRFVLILLAVVLLCGCAADPVETTLPPETAAPVETTIPVQTTIPVETAAPAPAPAPICADYAEESFNAYYAYWSDETDFITSIGFTPTEKLTDVTFSLLTWEENYRVAEVLYTIDAMDPEHPFLAQMVFWGDMTTYGISFTDAGGQGRHYAISISGKDGSLLCTEYTP